MSASERALRRFLRAILVLYPRVFHRQFGEDFVETHVDRCRAIGLRHVPVAIADALWGAMLEWRPQGRAVARHGRKGRSMHHFLHDLRFAWRSFSRTPGTAVMALATLAIGIGATAAIFSVIHAVLLDPLPYGRSERLALAWRQNPALGGVQIGPSREDAEKWRGASTLDGMTVFGGRSYTLTGAGEPEQITGRSIEPGLFDFLGVRPALGRAFTPADVGSPAAARVVILGSEIWKRRFGADPLVVGRTVDLSDQSYEIVGVMPDRFRLALGKGDIWVPMAPMVAGARAEGGASVLVRVKDGVSFERAEAELSGLMGAEDIAGAQGRWTAHLMRPAELAGATFRRALLVLLGAVACVLLIGCANIAALLLARNAGRARELAMRVALGASRGRLVRQLLTESLLLSIAGGAAGIVLGRWILQILSAIRPAQMDQLENLSFNPLMLALAGALAVVTGLVFGVIPAVASTRVSLNDALKQSARLAAHRTGSVSRRVLTVGEVALACVLLVGAGLLIRSYGRMLSASPGFQPEHRIAMTISLPSARFPTPASRADFFGRLLEETRGLPGVQSAALGTAVPPFGGVIFSALEVDGLASTQASPPSAFGGGDASPGFFRTLGIRIVDGREFADTDRNVSTVIVNEASARKWWPGQSALGKRLRFGPKSPWLTVIGVAGDVKTSTTFSDIQVYQRLDPSAMDGGATLVVSTTGDPAQMAGALKGQVWNLDPRLPVTRVATLEQAMSETMSRPRFNLILLGSFAFVGLLLAAVGIYGVISCSVGQRTQEIGLRMALGAVPRDIRRSVVGEAALLAGVGLSIGVAGALLVTRVMSAMLFEVSPTDPVSFGVTVAVLGLTALLAAWVPARRAMRVDPMVALRAE